MEGSALSKKGHSFTSRGRMTVESPEEKNIGVALASAPITGQSGRVLVAVLLARQ